MDENIRTALANEILGELQNLNDLEFGSKEHQAAVDTVTKLYRVGLEDVRNDTDYDEKLNRREMELQQREQELEKQERDEAYRDKQAKEQQIDRYVKYGLEVAGIVLPLMFYATWMRRGFEFEKEGTYTSTTFRGLFNRFRPTKK